MSPLIFYRVILSDIEEGLQRLDVLGAYGVSRVTVARGPQGGWAGRAGPSSCTSEDVACLCARRPSSFGRKGEWEALMMRHTSGVDPGDGCSATTGAGAATGGGGTNAGCMLPAALPPLRRPQ